MFKTHATSTATTATTMRNPPQIAPIFGQTILISSKNSLVSGKNSQVPCTTY